MTYAHNIRAMFNAALHTRKNPWFLVLGPKGSGKSTILRTLGYHLLPNTTNSSSDNNDFAFWYHAETLFLTLNSNISETHWKTVSNAFKRSGHKRRLQGIVLTLDIDTLTTADPGMRNHLVDRLQQWRQYAPNADCYLLITQCDRITGFQAFFRDAGPTFRQKIWGIDQPSEAQYDAWIHALQLCQIEQLHRAHTPEQRREIYDFPAQMAQLQTHLQAWIRELIQPVDDRLHGPFFSSARQSPPSHNILDALLPHTLYQMPARPITESETRCSQDYFLQQLWRKIQNSATSVTSDRSMLSRLLWGVAFCIMVGSGLLAYQNYQHSIITLRKMRTVLHAAQSTAPLPAKTTQEPPKQPSALVELLSRLNRLRQAADILHQAAHPTRWDQLQALHTQAAQHYQHALITQMLPQLKAQLEYQLEHHQSPAHTYESLKCYVMLASPERLDASAVLHCFAQTGDPAWKEHLIALLNLPFPPVRLNDALIARTLKLLKKISPEQLVLSFVQSALPQEHASLYTAQQLEPIYYQSIPRISRMLVEQDRMLPGWTTASLIAHTRTRYLTDYATYWQKIFAAADPRRLANSSQSIPLNNLIHIRHAVRALIQPGSHLSTTLATIGHNTQITPSIDDFAQQVRLPLASVANIQAALAPTSVSHHALEAIDSLLTTLMRAQDPEKAAYEIALQHMQQKMDALNALRQAAHDAPTRLRSWMESIATDLWEVLLLSSRAYINTAWSRTAAPYYAAHLQQRYPFFAHSYLDTTLEAFATFLGPKGIMEDFFDHYLKNFVNTEHFYWSWKKIDGKALPIPQTTLEMFMRASLIRKMYFTQNDNKMEVHFTLLPTALMPTTHYIALRLGDQTLRYTLNQKFVLPLTWPQQHEGADLTFVHHNHQHASLHTRGTWALFRLLDKGHIKSTENGRRFSLTFDINGNAAKFELLTDKTVNPFIPHIVHQFRCPRYL